MIEYGLTEEQKAFQTMAREFAEREIRPRYAEIDRIQDPAKNFPWDIIKKASKIGLRTHALPKEYGGYDTDLLTWVVMIDELTFVDVSCSKTLTQCWKISRRMALMGTKDQKDRFLTAFRDDDSYLLAQAYTEPDAGSDNLLPYDDPKGGMRLSAKRQGKGWVLNGIKHFTANGGVAKLYIVAARTDSTVGVSKGATAFFVPRESPGFSISRVFDKVGWRAYSLGELVFENVFVPDENVFGEIGKGLEQGPTAGHSNLEVSAHALAIARAAYEAALDHAKVRIQGGRPIIEHQAIATVMADMYIQLQAGRSLLWKAAWLGTHAEMDRQLSRASKVFCSEACVKICTQAMEIFGGMGVMKDLPIEKYVRDSLLLLHMDGTSQINRIRLGRGLANLQAQRETII